MVFQGGLAIGSAFWGGFAERINTPAASSVAVGALISGLPVARGYSLTCGITRDQSPGRLPSALKRAGPQIVIEPNPEDGPVLGNFSYQPLEGA